MRDPKNKYLGIIIGTYLGDVLGHPFEWQTADTLKSMYKSQKSRDVFNIILSKGEHSINTEILYLTAKLIADSPNIINDPDKLENELQKEVFTSLPPQYYTTELLDMLRDYRSENLHENEFYNMYSSNGGAVRISPLVLAALKKKKTLVKSVQAATRATYAHIDSIIGAEILALISEYLIKVTKSRFSFSDVIAIMHDVIYRVNEIYIDKIGKTYDKKWIWEKKIQYIEYYALRDNIKDKDIMKIMGNDYKALYSVPTAVFIFLHYMNKPEKAFESAINMYGDTSTIAAMTGTLLGAYWGIKKLPEKWIDSIAENEMYEKLYELAKRLFKLVI